MYVAADDAITAVRSSIATEILFVVAYEVHCLLDLVLGPSTEAPRSQSDTTSCCAHGHVEGYQRIIGPAAQMCQPFGMLDHHVKLVTVHDLVAQAVGASVHTGINQLDVTKVMVAKAAQELVMVAGQVGHSSTLACLPQDLLYDIVVCLRPKEALAHGPTVDDVAHQEQIVSFKGLEELQQRGSVAHLGTKVHV